MKCKLFGIALAGVLSVLSCGASSAQEGRYGSPLDVQVLQTSSGFGKLRGGRYHSGTDLRTGGVEGKKVLAVEDGYIYRIGIQPYGYGKVLYVAHADGTISVYGHLSRFQDAVEKYVKSERYRRKVNRCDLFPPADMFPVKRGGVIGLSGNTGNSYGPHLHFEIRDRGGERTLNPFPRGYFDIRDEIPPVIYNVWYYTVDTLRGVPVHTLAARAAAVADGNGHYRLDRPMEMAEPGYFAVETMDRKNGVDGKMTTYRITLRADGEERITYAMDGFTFAQNHLARIVSDYNLNRRTKNDVFRLAVVSDEAAPFYRNVMSRGIIDPASVENVSIEVWDDNGNAVTLDFPVVYVPGKRSLTLEIPAGAEAVDNGRNYSRRTDSLKVTLPAGALYEPLFYTQGKAASHPALRVGAGTRVLTDVYDVHRDDVPLKSPATLSFRVAVPEALQNKVVLARVLSDGRLAAASASYSDGNVTGKASVFGQWCVATDTTPPVVKPSVSSGADLSGRGSISFAISDDLSGVASYMAEVDGKWVIVEHETVQHRLVHYFDDELCGRGRNHTIKVTVTDGVGNSTTCTVNYYR